MIDHQLIRDLQRLAECEARIKHAHTRFSGDGSARSGSLTFVALRVRLATFLRAMANVLEPHSTRGELRLAPPCNCD